jgi:RNA polymerase sigma-70 factor (ECF subfamily)
MTSISKLDLGRLYADHRTLVMRRILRFLHRPEADDVFQEVFLKAAEHGEGFRADASPATWLYRVATNLCLDRLHREGRRRQLLVLQEPAVTRPGAALAPDDRALFHQLVATLPADLLAIAVYYHLDGMTHGQIAALLGVSRRTVGNRLEELTAHANRLTREAADVA